MAVYTVKSYGKKRQPDHRCPVCGVYYHCHRYIGMSPCPLPHEVQCGGCGMKLHAMAMQIHADELAKILIPAAAEKMAAKIRKTPGILKPKTKKAARKKK
jgi:hypothetical protein